MKAIRETEDALVFSFGIDPDHGKIRTHLIAEHALDHVQVVIDERRRFAALRARLDFVPEIFQEAYVSAQFLITRTGCCRTHDESAAAIFAFALNDVLQSLPLILG